MSPRASHSDGLPSRSWPPRVTQNENQRPGLCAIEACHCVTLQVGGREGAGGSLSGSRGTLEHPGPLAPCFFELTGEGRLQGQLPVDCLSPGDKAAWQLGSLSRASGVFGLGAGDQRAGGWGWAMAASSIAVGGALAQRPSQCVWTAGLEKWGMSSSTFRVVATRGHALLPHVSDA